MALTVEVAQGIEELFVGSVLYGLYLPTLYLCVQRLIWDDNNSRFVRPKSVQWVILIAALVLGICSSVNLALGVLRSQQAFAHCVTPDTTGLVFSSVSDWVNMVKGATTCATLLIVDGILIYRCWLIWSRKVCAVSIPIVLWLANLGIAIAMLIEQSTVTADSVIYVSKVKALLISITSIPVPLNALTTSLIVYRLWSLDRGAGHPFLHRGEKTRLKNAIRIIVESGLLYTATVFVCFCTYLANSNAFYIATVITIRMAGIAFNLIVIRTQNQTFDQFPSLPTSHSFRFCSPQTQPPNRTSMHSKHYSQDYDIALPAVNVHPDDVDSLATTFKNRVEG